MLVLSCRDKTEKAEEITNTEDSKESEDNPKQYTRAVRAKNALNGGSQKIQQHRGDHRRGAEAYPVV